MHKDLAAFVADLERRDTQWHELAEYYFEASLKLEASVKAHNEIFEALRECEEKRNAQSLRLEQCAEICDGHVRAIGMLHADLKERNAEIRGWSDAHVNLSERVRSAESRLASYQWRRVRDGMPTEKGRLYAVASRYIGGGGMFEYDGTNVWDKDAWWLGPLPVVETRNHETLPKLAEWETDKGVSVTVYDGPNTSENNNG